MDPIARTSQLLGVDERDRSVALLFSTNDVDLENEVVDQGSWKLDRFLKNPVVLWNHDGSQRPIGKVTELTITPDGLAGRIQLASARANPVAEEIWQGLREGIIRAASVRFVPGTRKPQEQDGKLVDVLENNELLEVSIVAVGSNPATVVPQNEEELRAARLSAAGRALARGKPITKTDSQDTVLRLDGGRLGKVQRTPSGGIRAPARLTRTGVLTYTRADGTKLRELRMPEEVFAADSLATLQSAPVTDHHPSFGLVDPTTWKQVSVGHVEAARQDGSFVAAELVVQDAAEIAKIDAGERQDISAGYRCRLEFAPGVYKGEHYDAIQRGITYNHVALLPKGGGRAGTDVGLRLDSSDAVLADEAFIESEEAEETSPMKVIKIDGKDFDFGSEAHIAKLEDLHQAEVSALKTQISTANSDRDKATARADAADQDVARIKGELATATDPKAVADKVNARVDLLVKAKGILGEKVTLDGKSDREVMVDAVRIDDKDFTGEGKSDDYVRARFDVVTSKGVRADSIHSVVAHAQQLRSDSRDPAAKAAEENIKKSQEAWRQPLALSKA
jgi:HK97 family phage prohead protease